MSRPVQAGWMIVAMTLAAVATVLAKLLTQELGVIQILWLRLVLGCLFLWPLAVVTIGRAMPAFTRLHALRAVVLIGMTGLWFFALSLGPVGRAAVMSYTYPVFILVFAAIFFGQKINGWDIISLVLSFIGVAVIFSRGWEGGATSAQGLLQVGVVLCSSILIAVRVSVEKVMTASVEPVDILMGSMMIATVIVAPAAYVVWVPINLHELLLLSAMSLTATIAQLIVIWLLRRGAWSAVSVFAFWEVLAAILLAMILFGEILAPVAAIGAVLIIAGGLILVVRGDA